MPCITQTGTMEEDAGEYLADYFGDDWDNGGTGNQPQQHPQAHYYDYSAQDASAAAAGANANAAEARAAAVHAQYAQQMPQSTSTSPDTDDPQIMAGCITSADLRPTDILCGRGNYSNPGNATFVRGPSGRVYVVQVLPREAGRRRQDLRRTLRCGQRTISAAGQGTQSQEGSGQGGARGADVVLEGDGSEGHRGQDQAGAEAEAQPTQAGEAAAGFCYFCGCGWIDEFGRTSLSAAAGADARGVLVGRSPSRSPFRSPSLRVRRQR